MRWLFLFFLFEMTNSGIEPKLRASMVFPSEEQCNQLGREMAERLSYPDGERVRSFSTCVPESLYEAREFQIQRYDE